MSVSTKDERAGPLVGSVKRRLRQSLSERVRIGGTSLLRTHRIDLEIKHSGQSTGGASPRSGKELRGGWSGDAAARKKNQIAGWVERESGARAGKEGQRACDLVRVKQRIVGKGWVVGAAA